MHGARLKGWLYNRRVCSHPTYGHTQPIFFTACPICARHTFMHARGGPRSTVAVRPCQLEVFDTSGVLKNRSLSREHRGLLQKLFEVAHCVPEFCFNKTRVCLGFFLWPLGCGGLHCRNGPCRREGCEARPTTMGLWRRSRVTKPSGPSPESSVFCRLREFLCLGIVVELLLMPKLWHGFGTHQINFWLGYFASW